MLLPVVFIRRRFFTGSDRSLLSRRARPRRRTNKKFSREQAGKTQGSAGTPVALAAAVRVIFAAWLVLALLLLGLGRLTMAKSREPAAKRLSALR